MFVIPRRPLSGIQSFKTVRIWIPDYNELGNNNSRLLQKLLFIHSYGMPPELSHTIQLELFDNPGKVRLNRSAAD